MKRLFTFFLCFPLAYAFSWAQSETPSVHTPRPEENSLLWKISGNGLEQSSYLFGTIHMIGKEDYFFNDTMQASFKETQQVAFEIDMEEMSDFSTLMPLMMKAFMANGTTLRDLVTEDDYELVQDHFNKIGLPMMLLDRIKPMFLSAMTSGDMLNSGGGMDSVVSYEMELMKMAKEQEKKIFGLETAEFQMSMFDSIPYKAQAKMLVESIKSGEEGDDQFAEMVDLYKNQDIYGMQTMLKEDEEGVGDFEDLLLAGRNRNWIPVMMEMMTEKPTFFAVGAGHLGGTVGVIALLREKGYIVVPIR